MTVPRVKKSDRGPIPCTRCPRWINQNGIKAGDVRATVYPSDGYSFALNLPCGGIAMIQVTTKQTRNHSSALAIRLRSKPHRLVVPHMPVGLLSCRPPKATRKKSAPGPTTLCAPRRAHLRRSDLSCGTRPSAKEHRRRHEPYEGGQGAGSLETPEPRLLVRVRSEVDLDQVRLASHGKSCREILAPTDAWNVWGRLTWVKRNPTGPYAPRLSPPQAG